jgi:hypothetical protein
MESNRFRQQFSNIEDACALAQAIVDTVQAASFSRLVKGRKASVPIFDQCRSSVKVMT